MFFNLRYITLIVYGIIIIVSLLLGVYFKYYTTEYFVRDVSQKQAQETADNYVKLIWNKYYPVIGFLADKPIATAETFPQYLAFVEESNRFFSSNNITKVVIYGANGALYQSNNLALNEKQSLFSSYFYPNEVSNSLDKIKMIKSISSVVIPSAEIEDGRGEQISLVKTFLPIAPQNALEELKNLAAKAGAILEINYNVSSELKVIEIIQFTAIFFIISSFGVITLGVFLSAQQAEKMIEKQQEATAELSVARTSAETQSKEKSKFLANVTHELRTPLNAIIGFSEIISSESMGPINNEQYKEFIRDIHTSGLHLLSLINDILDFSKAEENKLDAIFEDVDLTKVIKISLKMLMPRAEQAKVILKDELPEEHIIISADNKRLKQVVLNLLSNSVKFTPEGGSVTIKAWKNLDLNLIIIEVIDTGLGMEPQDIARALTPFGQIDNKLSRKYDGTGLGLPLTKKLVEIMKGKFEIKSEPGLGTSITLTFPLPGSQIEEDKTT
ncbi:sensor histidine kinase [endosymbiont of Acanthamoeba sp. UWC8]|nr:sensor histidine kinase [endosymbiont of Acanthamoeba sp. UWC8]